MAYMVVTDSLVANWDAKNFTSGTVWRDSVNNKAINFTSAPSKSNDGIEIPTSITFSSESLSDLGLTFPISIEWLGRIDSNSFDNTHPGNILGIGSSAGEWDNSICIYSKLSPNSIQVDADSSGTLTSGIYNTDQEYHILITIEERANYFGSDTITFYVNSANSVDSASYTRWTGDGNDSFTSNKNYVYNSEGTGRFDGAISAIRIWDKCLSDSEVEQVFTFVQDKFVYIKQNGSWVTASKYYKKQNGIWVEQSDPSALTDSNTKYVLHS